MKNQVDNINRDYRYFIEVRVYGYLFGSLSDQAMSIHSRNLGFLEADVLKLVHRVLLATSLQCRLTREIFLVVISYVCPRHVLVLHTVQSSPDLLPLHLLHVGQHGLLAEVSREMNVSEDKSAVAPCLFSPLGQDISGESGGVIGRQCDQVMEHSGHTGGFRLEIFYLHIRRLTEGGLVVLRGHEETPVVARHVLPASQHLVVDLLAEVQGPVEGGTVVVDQLSPGNLQNNNY